MSVANQIDFEELDREWIDLCLTAHELGLSTDDIRTFLRSTAPIAQNVYIPTSQ
ncbi:MAG: anti-repressor SinI family protein [Paenibacillaceae bacterium]